MPTAGTDAAIIGRRARAAAVAAISAISGVADVEAAARVIAGPWGEFDLAAAPGAFGR
jgi:hypothetical protein